MRILHVITSLRTGGAEKLMVDLLPRLRDMGNEIELLLFDGTRTPFYEELENSGIKIHSLSLGGNVYNPLNIFKLCKYLKKYDIIHTHNTACQYFIPLAKIISCSKCKLYTTEHSTNNRRRQYKLFKISDKFIYNKYHTLVSISKKATETLKAFIGEKHNIATIENGVDISKFNNISKPILNKTFKIISMVAGFRVEKDQDTLIRAISLLPESYKLWLIGDGERRQELESLVRSLSLENRVKFWGIRNDIPQLLEQTDIVVLSSHWEGLSLSSIEGMASGRPFIASDVNGLKEIVNGSGILFPHGDENTLASEIKSLCENHELYKLVATACQTKAKQYDINIMAKKYNNLYHDK